MSYSENWKEELSKKIQSLKDEKEDIKEERASINFKTKTLKEVKKDNNDDQVNKLLDNLEKDLDFQLGRLETRREQISIELRTISSIIPYLA